MSKYKNIGDKIKMHREKMNWSQDQFAAMLEMTRGNLSSYEVGRNAPPVPALTKIADLLKVSTDYLLGRTNDPKQLLTKEGLPLVPEEEARLQKFLSETEQLMRENASGYDEATLRNFLKFMEFNFINDIDPKKRNK